jgi:hypothetical protein
MTSATLLHALDVRAEPEGVQPHSLKLTLETEGPWCIP